MASLDSLPADQKAVLSLVLQRGRSFDQIADLLSIDRAAVRQRALDGLDGLGPDTSVDPLKRGLITDYLLGQLPAGVATMVADSLAANPQERAWARVIAAEIAPLAVNGLPEIPAARSAGGRGADSASTGGAVAAAAPARVERERFDDAAAFAEDADRDHDHDADHDHDHDHGRGADGHRGADAPPSSRRGGAILLGLIALIVVVVVVVLLVTGGSSSTPASKQASSGGTPPASTPGATTPAGTGVSGTSTGVTPLHQINLVSPTTVKGRQGAADVVRAAGKLGIVLVAEGLPANTANAYAVWLHSSKTGGSEFLGFYSQKVAASGKTAGQLEAENALPADATKYDQLLLTLETSEHPKAPGTIVLEGSFAE